MAVLCFSLSSEHQLAHVASLRLSVDQQAEFEVGFCPSQPLSAKAKMVLRVEGNQYNDVVIQLVGEAYQDIISLDNISGEPMEAVTGQEEEEGRRGEERGGGEPGRRGLDRRGGQEV